MARPRFWCWITWSKSQADEAAQILRTLLIGVPHLTCFATSRRRVGVPGERLFPVSPLSPTDAVRLFADRAGAVSDFSLTNASRAETEALCADLEGLPLALELAAAWSAVLSPQEMRGKLQERFALLSTRQRDKTDRHRSLWAAIAWSYDLLPRDLQQTWAELSVFEGGWTKEAAAFVTGDQNNSASEALARLCERSLLVRGSGAGGSTRFFLLPSLRDFARDLLSDFQNADLREKHAAYFAGFVQQAKENLFGEQHTAFMNALDHEMPNVRVALSHHGETVGSQSAVPYLRFANSAAALCRARNYLRDARDFLNHALARTNTEATLCLPDVQAARASAFNTAGLVAWMQGDPDAAAAHFEAARAFWQAQNDEKGVGRVLGNLALLAMERDETEKAWNLCHEALPYLQNVGDLGSVANTLGTMGNARLEQERWDEGRAHHTKSLALYRAMKDTDGVSIALASLGYAAQFAGDFSDAAACYKESLQLRHAARDTWRISFSLGSVADLLWAQKNALPALTLYAAADALRQSLDAPLGECRQQKWNLHLAAMRLFRRRKIRKKGRSQGRGNGLGSRRYLRAARFGVGFPK